MSSSTSPCSTAVCTLFDNDYNLGAAALFNSIIRAGYAGTLIAGFRGQLPTWAWNATRIESPLGTKVWQRQVSEKVDLLVVELDASIHLANYKPWFMLEILDRLEPQVLYYLDPDICVTRPWQYFDEWISCGVALCEDVNSPLAEHHPRRVGWRRAFDGKCQTLVFRSPIYLNSGLVGVHRQHRRFLETWRDISELVFELIGGGATTKVEGGAEFSSRGFANCFDAPDQDALNAAVEACGEVRYSMHDGSAMGFRQGDVFVPHAVGGGKPWRRNYLRYMLQGIRPRPADLAFWRNVDGPLPVLAEAQAGKLRAIAVASAIGRFYRRA
jgi:hypothetical protein